MSLLITSRIITLQLDFLHQYSSALIQAKSSHVIKKHECARGPDKGAKGYGGIRAKGTEVSAINYETEKIK